MWKISFHEKQLLDSAKNEEFQFLSSQSESI